MCDPHFGAYASRTRVFRKKCGLTLHSLNDNENATSKAEPELSPKKRTALRKSWAQLIKRVYQIDPLKCECGGTLHGIAFITQRKLIRNILVQWKSKTATPALLQNTNRRFTIPFSPIRRRAALLVRLHATT